MVGRRSKSWIKPALRVVVGVIVLGAVGRQILRTGRDLVRHDPPLRLDPLGLALAVPLYVVGLVVFGLFYARVLRSSASPIGLIPAVRAYLISHLGKYVPGKALVVVMRAGLSAAAGARPATAAFATLYETLLMMGAGGVIACVGFAWTSGEELTLGLGPLGEFSIGLSLLGLAAGVGFLTMVSPRVFPRLSAAASLPFPGVGPEALPALPWRLLGLGFLLSCLGWTLLGLSQVAVIQALQPAGLPWETWPLAIASVALATVAGFVIPVAPGGLGVREWVLWTALGTVLDRDHAVVASLTLRLCWVVGELLAAALVAPFRPHPGPSS